MRACEKPGSVRVRWTALLTLWCAFGVAAFPVLPAHADTLSDLRAALHALAPLSSLKATLDVKSTTTRKKVNGGKPVSGEAKIGVQVGDGLSLHFAPALLHRAHAELTAAATAAVPTPTASLLKNAVDPTRVVNLVEAGPWLLNAMSGATTASVEATTLFGAPARKLTMTLPQPKSTDSSIKLKNYTDVVSVWLNADGIPIAYSEASGGEGCLVLLCMHAKEQQTATFTMIGGCLVVTSRTTGQKTSGLGQGSDTHNVYTLAVQQARCAPASPGNPPVTLPAPAAGTQTPAATKGQ